MRELFRLIDWMMHLRADWEQRFRAELAQFEEQTRMSYITSVERLAKAEGKAEGGVSILLNILRRVCGPLPEEVETRVRRLAYPEIEALSEALLTFRTLDDLRTWLDANPPKSTKQ